MILFVFEGEKREPELPESPYLIRKNEKKAQRIRHSK